MILILYTTLYREGGDKFARAARTLEAEKRRERPDAAVRAAAVESKADVVARFREAGEAGDPDRGAPLHRPQRDVRADVPHPARCPSSSARTSGGRWRSRSRRERGRTSTPAAPRAGSPPSSRAPSASRRTATTGTPACRCAPTASAGSGCRCAPTRRCTCWAAQGASRTVSWVRWGSTSRAGQRR